ncbi:MAG: hypothetical protein NWE89_04205 [Candidatus Bathyarchaeota archaeon]|nr:hypothetical protein [Candidatus Bathyarchaeota archaeon]
MDFHPDIVFIIGHNGASVTSKGEYYLFFGGYNMAEEFNGVLVDEHEIEMAINHEVLHCVMDSLGEDAKTLDNIWFKYDVPYNPVLSECSEMGLGF